MACPGVTSLKKVGRDGRMSNRATSREQGPTSRGREPIFVEPHGCSAACRVPALKTSPNLITDEGTKLREGKWLSQGHTASKCKGEDLNSGLRTLDPESFP